jgi:hypothetical protein
MSTIKAPPEVVFILSTLTERTEILDPHGRTLGFYTPQMIADDERLKSLFDVAEAERILATESGRGRQLQNIWRDLRGEEASK